MYCIPSSKNETCILAWYARYRPAIYIRIHMLQQTTVVRMRCAANQRSPATWTDAQASGRYSRIMAPRFSHLTSLSRATVLPDYTASSIATGSPLS
jgi:hypothetical protein